MISRSVWGGSRGGMGWSGVGMVLIVAALALFISPAGAAPSGDAAIETSRVQEMRVDEVADALGRYKVWILAGASALVVMFLVAGGLLRPKGFEKAGLRKIDTIPWAIWLFAGLVTFLALGAGDVVLSRMDWFAQAELSDQTRQIISTAVGFALGALAAFGMLFILAKSCPEGGLGFHWLDLAVGLGCFALAFPVVELSKVLGVYLHSQLAEGEPPAAWVDPHLATIAGDAGDPWVWLLAATFVVGRPIIDELVFRVFVQSALGRIFGSPWAAIVVGAAVYALMQRIVPFGGQRVPWHELVPFMLLGLCAGVAYERTKRVGVPIAMHACFQIVALVLALAGQTGGGEAAPAG